jgi:hypothetical protein
MIWAFKMFFKIIGKVLLYSFCIPFAIVCLPFYLPYYLIKERRNKKRGRIPKYSPSMSGQDYEKGADDLRWIDTIEEYHAAID